MSNLDFNKYTKLEDYYKYDGFIGPDGSFYRVSKNGVYSPTHNEWAQGYIMNDPNYIKSLAHPSTSFLYTMARLKGKLEVLIHFYGFIYYGHNMLDRTPIIIYPDYSINNKEVTASQFDTLYKLLEKKNELDYIPSLTEEETDDINHDKYVDDFISKLFGKE